MNISAELCSRFNLSASGGKGAQFADPFLMDSAAYMPDNLANVWDYCYFLFYLNPNFRRAVGRTISYFIQDVEFVGDDHGDEKEQKEHKEILMDQIGLPVELHTGGLEWGAYGNSFLRFHLPFQRVLVDWRGDRMREYSITMLEELGPVKYNYREMTYTVVDPADSGKAVSKRKKVNLPFRDRPLQDVNLMKLIRLDPRDVILHESLMGNETRVIQRFSQDFITKVRRGNPFDINSVPIEFLEAIANSEDFMYYPGQVYHLKAPTIKGLKNNGWGIPETLANYRHLHQLQVLRRIDEAVGQDYLLPFRIFSPPVESGGAGGPVYDTLFGHWKSELSELIARRRMNPYAIHALPFPVTYQELGGGANGKQLVQADAVEFHTNNLLDAFGVPVELQKGTLQIQNWPAALRMFESDWHFLYWHFNNITKWASNAVRDVQRSQRLGVRLKRSSMADDLEERGIYLQLAASGEISRARAYSPLNIENPVEEKKRRMQEDIDIERDRLRIEKEFQQEQTIGSLNNVGAEEGGDGSAGGYGNPPAGAQVNPLDVMNQAEEKAKELLQLQDQGQRTKILAQLQATDPNMHAAVKQKLNELRSQGESMGRAQVGQMIAQQQQGGGQ